MTTIQTHEQKLHHLQQKLELAKELGLTQQMAMICNEIRISKLEQTCTYPEVTQQEARAAMCPITVTEFKPKWVGFMKKEKCGYEVMPRGFTLFSGPHPCEKIDKHSHTDQLGLRSEILQLTEEKTLLPLAALIRMKEAKEKNVFESFQVWRPETASEAEARKLDPWLVGVVGNRYFKLCDWR